MDQHSLGVYNYFIPGLLQRQLNLPTDFVSLGFPRLDGSQSSFDTQRFKEPQDLATDCLVNTQSAERDTAFRPMIDVGALAMVAGRTAVSATVGDMQLAAAMAATQQSGQERLSLADGSTDHQALAVGIVGDQALVPLILTPRDVSLVMAGDQHLPVLPLAPDAMGNLLAALNQLNPAAGPAERVGPSINGIGQQVMDSVVDRRLPNDVPALGAVIDCG
ncbi:hypothetical protein N826_30340 [Skermanella aerolata KACC 11604]|nr:hypothetical protein N826_30340 [Skermanella aerolata KACC 11604]